jgi:hypothetical protein
MPRYTFAYISTVVDTVVNGLDTFQSLNTVIRRRGFAPSPMGGRGLLH